MIREWDVNSKQFIRETNFTWINCLYITHCWSEDILMNHHLSSVCITGEIIIDQSLLLNAVMPGIHRLGYWYSFSLSLW